MAQVDWDEMKEGGFGTLPYRGYRYGSLSPDNVEDITSKLKQTTNELDRIKLILELLKRGDFSARNLLVPLLKSRSPEVRRYSAQLFSDTCSHDQVHHLESSYWAAEDPDEVLSVVLDIGATYSLQAIPLLWQIREDIGDYPELDGYLHTALTDILSLEGIDEYSLDSSSAREACAWEVGSLDPTKYYCGGKPIFPGDLTQKVIIYAAVANREGPHFKLFTEPRVLSNFSGINCPVRHGMEVSDAVLRGVLDYTLRLSRMKWTRGMKYFYGHPVGS